jgi:hypothetical protein
MAQEKENLKDKNNILDSGFTRNQTYYALKKAQIGYHLSNKENNLEGKEYYAWMIHKLERELGMHAIPFREVKMLALEFYGKNPELFKQDEVECEKVLKVMMKRGLHI